MRVPAASAHNTLAVARDPVLYSILRHRASEVLYTGDLSADNSSELNRVFNNNKSKR